MGLIYFIVKILTFPGTVFKAFLEHLTCRMYEIPIEYSKYIQKNELCGHIEHLLAPQKGSFGVCFMPHIISLVCGLVFILCSGPNLFYLGKVNFLSVIFFWLGISCLTNCFPLLEDAVNMWEKLFSSAKPISRILLAAPAGFMYVGAYLEKYCITLLLSIGFAYGLPYLLALFV